jgi:hypothetical protein
MTLNTCRPGSGSDAPPARLSRHAPDAELAHLAFAFTHRGRATDALGRALVAIAGAVWDRHRFLGDRDEFVAECFVHLLGGPIHDVDAEQDPTDYLTACAVRFGHRLRHREAVRRRRERDRRAAVAEAYRRPDRRR